MVSQSRGQQPPPTRSLRAAPGFCSSCVYEGSQAGEDVLTASVLLVPRSPDRHQPGGATPGETTARRHAARASRPGMAGSLPAHQASPVAAFSPPPSSAPGGNIPYSAVSTRHPPKSQGACWTMAITSSTTSLPQGLWPWKPRRSWDFGERRPIPQEAAFTPSP